MKFNGYFKIEVEADNEHIAELLVRGWRVKKELTDLEFLEVEQVEEGHQESEE